MTNRGRNRKRGKTRIRPQKNDSVSPRQKQANCTPGNEGATRDKDQHQNQNVATVHGAKIKSPDQCERSDITTTNTQNPSEQPSATKPKARDRKAWRNCCEIKINAWAATANTFSCIAAVAALWFVYGQMTAMRDQLDLMKTDSQSHATDMKSQLDVMAKQAKTMEDQFAQMLLDSRPWVGSMAPTLEPNKPGELRRCQLQFTNTGKTPAFKFRARAVIKYLTPDSNMVDLATRYENDQIYPPTSLCPLPPNMIFTLDKLPNNSLETPMDGIVNGSRIAYVFGIARYEDYRRCGHTTRFCYFFDRKGNRWAAHNQYNHMD